MANQTKGGKKRTFSVLVVVGNGNGMAGQNRYSTVIIAEEIVCVCVFRICSW